MNDIVLSRISEMLYAAGKQMGFSKPIIRSDRYSTDIFIIKNHALQIEVDWHENNLFMYVVYLKNNTLPGKNTIYRYKDGHWCRKYLEEIYKAKRPCVRDLNKRYSPEYLFDCLTFYQQLIDNNPSILTDFYNSIDIE